MRILGFLLGLLIVGAISLGLGLRLPGQTGGAIASDAEPMPQDAAEPTSASGTSTGSLPSVVPEAISASAPPAQEEHGIESAETPAGATGEAAHTVVEAVQNGLSQSPQPADQAFDATLIAQGGGAGDWEAFFTSFRSQASADGFASFLRTATGREFRVDRAGPGDYRVWLLIEPGESRRERIREIEAVTGMTLGGGAL